MLCLGKMKHWIWIIFLYLVDFITAEQGTSDQISLVLREEWLSRNLAEGELKQFHEEDVVSDYDIKILLEEKRGLPKKNNFTIIRGLLKNEKNEILLPENLYEFVNFLSVQFNTTVFDKSYQVQMTNKRDQGKVEFSLMVPWQALPIPDLNPKQKSTNK